MFFGYFDPENILIDNENNQILMNFRGDESEITAEKKHRCWMLKAWSDVVIQLAYVNQLVGMVLSNMRGT